MHQPSKTLREVDLSENPVLDNGGRCLGEAVRISCTLTTLVLNSTGMRAQGVAALLCGVSKSQSIESLDLSTNDVSDDNMMVCSAASLALKGCVTLKTLNLSMCNISHPASVAVMGDGVVSSTSLCTLVLSHNPFSDAGAKSLAVALEQNSSVTVLSLSHCRITQVFSKHA